RWLSRDPLGEVEESFKKPASCRNGNCLGKKINPFYDFASNNPLNQYDVFGLLPNCPSGAKIRNCAAGTCEYRTGRQDNSAPIEINGCGSASTWWVPDSFFYVIDFTDACNTHDACYQQCGTPQGTCDSNLGFDMMSACSTWWMLTLFLPLYPECIYQAQVYQAAVMVVAGGIYEGSQDTHCEWDKCCN
ncbi:MAG: hypothetical protein WAX69_08615, partial [Victivallales bacterium]